jgi:hypothetical protein
MKTAICRPIWHCACGMIAAGMAVTPAGLPAQAPAGSSIQPSAESTRQESPGPAAGPPASEESLKNDQLAISGRFSRFERMLSQMADILGKEDPERADLLRRAISKGREQRVSERIETIVGLMESREFGSVVEEQQHVSEGLLVLLKLLQSEDRRSSVEKERERLNQLLKDVRNLIAEERSARAATQNSTAPSNAAPQQQKALDSAESMLQRIRESDEAKTADDQSSPDTESKSDETQPDSQEKPDSGKSTKPSTDPQDGKSPKDADPSPTQPSESPKNSQQSKDDKDGQKSSPPEKSESPPSPQNGSPGGQPQDQKDRPQQTPGREQLQQAQQLMQEALDQLKQQQKDPALEKQDEALAELHEAAAELEETLRQLREEEKEMLLAALEARFQRMLSLQTQIHEGTRELGAVPREQWLDQYYGRCRELAQQQTELTAECSQTAGLLREDGTSVSILLAVEDIESDMGAVAGYLRESRTGTLTQSVQTDIIEALKQLIEAAQKEMQDMKSEERKQQPPPPNSQDKPPLVELMAEIKVLRSLQLRVNRRTKQVDDLFQTVHKDELADLTQQLEELAVRQQRLQLSAGELAERMKPPRP